MQKQQLNSIILAVLLIVAAAISKVIIYPETFTPMFAIAIFAAMVIKDRKLAFALPLFAMFLSDLFMEISGKGVGFWGWGQLVGYGIFAIITIVASLMRKVTVLNIAVQTLFAPVLFYFLSNTSFFIFDNPVYHTYPQTFEGYKAAMIAGIPFLKWSIIATAAFNVVLFGVYFGFEKFAFKKQSAPELS